MESISKMEIERRLYIGNLPSGVDETLIRNRFSKYGKVLGVELKHRRAIDGHQDGEILSTFAFIDLSTRKEKFDICLRKLSGKKWDGQEIKIEFAKESALSRLEKERKELSSGDKSNNNNKETIRDESKSPALLNGNSKTIESSFRDHNVENFEENQTRQYQSNKRKLDSDIQQQNHSKARRNSESTIKSVETTQLPASQLSTAEQKRLKSLEEKIKLVADRKLAVKAALSSVDSAKRNNKIIFNDDDNDDDDGNFSEKRFVDHNELKNNISSYSRGKSPESSNPATSKKESNNLFDDSDDSDEEASNSRFEIKEHFVGKKGQKLLKLQSKYGNDSRFALDQRFAESSSSDEEEDKEEHENKETRKETANEDSDKMHVDNRDEDEVKRQMEILQNVVGHQIIKPQSDDSKPKKQKPGGSVKGNQLCVRFDPTIADHEKFIVKPPPPGSEVETKTSKKRKKNKNTEESNDNEQEIDKSDTEARKSVSSVEVSKETYYEVASDLKERLKSSGTGFSLSQLFSSDGKSINETENNRLQSSNKSKEKDSTANKQSVGFEKKTNDEISSEKMMVQSRTSGLSKLWMESFFFKPNDDRFKEGADFFMQNNRNNDASENFKDKRRELRLTVKNKMKRVIRKDKMFKKKIGGFSSKTNKFGKKRMGR